MTVTLGMIINFAALLGALGAIFGAVFAAEAAKVPEPMTESEPAPVPEESEVE